MTKRDHNLRDELQAAGASNREAGDLAQLAGQLAHLKTSRRPHEPFILVSVALAAVIILVTAAQSSLPGNWLYPVKKASESSLALVDPSFKGTMMVRRSVEIKQLVADHASKPMVMATLADYRQEAAAYKSGNYSVFADCRHNLGQAAASAPQDERQAIMATMDAIPSA